MDLAKLLQLDSVEVMEQVGVSPAAARRQEDGSAPAQCKGGWTPFALSEALSIQRGWRTKGGRPDQNRGANWILRAALDGRRVPLWFEPPDTIKPDV